MNDKLELVKYETLDLKLDPDSETVWLTQAQIAEIFGVATNTVIEHLKNIFRDEELEESSTTRKFRAVAANGKTYDMLHYTEEVAYLVGFRVNSKTGSRFRRWATSLIKEFRQKGIAVNEARIRDKPHLLDDAAEKLRAARAQSKYFNKKVTDVFKNSADYDKDSPIAREFFKNVADLMNFAVTGKSSAGIKLDRADHSKPSMGLQTVNGKATVRKEDADSARNYMTEKELYILYLIADQFLNFSEQMVHRSQTLTMSVLYAKFKALLAFNGYPIFPGYDFSRCESKMADAHVEKELELWRERTKALPREERFAA